MKLTRFLIIALLISFSSKYFAQNNLADSLLNLIKNHKVQDTARVNLLNEFAFEAMDQDHDQAYQTARESYKLAKHLNYKKGVANSYLFLGWEFCLFQYKIDSALNYGIKALKLAEELNDKTILSKANNLVSSCYQNTNDSLSMLYRQKAFNYAIEIKDFSLMASAERGISIIYVQRKNYGLALDNLEKALEYEKKTKTQKGLPGIYFYFGEAYERMNNLDSALFYYKLGLINAENNHYPRFIAGLRRKIGIMYMLKNDTANGFKNMKEGLEIAIKNNMKFQIQNLYSTLASAYRQSKNYQIALNYTLLYDSIKSAQMNYQVAQNMERMQQELKIEKEKLLSEKMKSEQERSANLQFVGIGIGIISLLILTLLLSRSIIVTPRLVKIFGIIGLLITFEFVNLLLHPLLERITHHSQVLMLLALAAIAALLVPLHHNLEKWITSKLVEKNKKIRLEKAKKIIEESESGKS